MSDRKLKGFIECTLDGAKRSFQASEVSTFWQECGACLFKLKGSGEEGCLVYPGTYEELKAKIAEAQQ